MMIKTLPRKTAATLARRAARMANFAWKNENIERHDKYEHLAFLLSQGIPSGEFVDLYLTDVESKQIDSLQKGSTHFSQ